MNFALSFLLLVAVNSNLDSAYGLEVKAWLIGFSMILAFGSLISVFGIDIERQTRVRRKIHGVCKLL